MIGRRKMRLIDADKLKEELEVNGLGYQYYMLDNAPTVEAIPIEWIEEYLNEVFDDSEYDMAQKEAIESMQVVWRLEQVFAKHSIDWRKENG